MQVVIDIDEKLYDYMRQEEYDKQLDKRFDYQIRFAVKNGTPLSKGHGRIGDLDKLDNRLKRMQHHYVYPLSVQGNAIAGGIALARSMIDNAPAIIKADKIGSER